ncbi:hypothetical protein ACHAWF_016264 [Thalassiosira exigua]
MAADTKIAALFNLPVESPPLHDEASCKFLVEHLSKFHDHLEGSKSRHPWINEEELGVLKSSLKALRATAPHEKIDWMPEYGCAVIKTNAGCTSGAIALNLIGLDLHQFQTTSKSASNSYSYIDSAIAKAYEVFHIGTCSVEKLEDVQGEFKRLLATAKTRTGDKRSARGGKQGHQRTPAFIHALYREAFGGSPNQLARGGLTDCGLHTGDHQNRDTSPPLVFYSLRQALEDRESEHTFSPDVLFQKMVVFFGLYSSESLLRQYEGTGSNGLQTNAPNILLEHALSIVRSTSIKAAECSDKGIDLSCFVDWSKSLRTKIIDHASSSADRHSQQYELPQSDADVLGTYKNFRFDLPKQHSKDNGSALDESIIRQNTMNNLGWLPIPHGKGLHEIHQWIMGSGKMASRQDSLASMLLLKTVETLLWDFAMDFSVDLPSMDQADLEKLASVVDFYRETLHKFKVSGKYQPQSIVELNSRELLVVWVAFCIIHFNTILLNKTEMEGYGVPLDYNDLSHLVLSSRDEWEVVLQVAKYLGKHGTSNAIFSLKDEKHTFDLGRRVARATPSMAETWEREDEDASGRVKGHWKVILQKQELARKLRAEISELEVKLADLKRQLVPKRDELAEHRRKMQRRLLYSCASYDSTAHNRCTVAVNSLQSKISSLEHQLSSKNSSLKNALQAPPPVFQPMPQEEFNAMPILFFLYMPPIFQLLSRFSFTSQQLRLPHAWTGAWGGVEGSEKQDITSIVTRGVESCQFSWKDYYNNHQSSQYHGPSHSRRGSDYHLLLRAVSNVVPHEVGPKSVDHIHSKSVGIWYPDELKPRMAWFGGTMSFDRASSGREVNPFAELNHHFIVSNFTERLVKHPSLQWTLMQPGEGHIIPSRANVPYARQENKPDWLSKPGWLSFANMRAYPNIQIRNVLLAIQERQLPLTESSVHTLMKQTLFHVGAISDIHTCPKFAWKVDLEDGSFGRDVHRIFESLYDEIKDSPKSYMCVKLAGQLCNFFSRWEPKCRDTARNLAASVCQWADSLGNDIEKSPPSQAPVIRAKQVVLYQHAIMAQAGGHLATNDVGLLIQLVVKCKHFFTGDNRLDEILANATEIKYVLSQNLDDIMQAASQRPTIMTEALRTVFQRCPSSLKWQRWSADGNVSTQCFQAKCSDGHCYSINLITGEVLINGLPPSRLPHSILSDPLYERTFGKRNFEVVGRGHHFLETCRPVFGRFYRFSTGTSNLRIYEFKEDESEMLELLDGTADGTAWAKDLPERLKTMHSHWFFRSRSLIVLRDISFKDRNISFLIEFTGGAQKNAEGRVRCIDLHSKQRDVLLNLTEDLSSMDTLVVHKSRALDVISKFEPKKFIHSMLGSAGKRSRPTLQFFLPRYNLSFVLLHGILACREIVGYHLRANQQTNGTFRGTTMYLMLEETEGKGRLIIFPKGRIVRETKGHIRVDIVGDCDKQVLWYQYEFHPRFDYIETKQSRAARMQLAALHTATSTLLPDEMLGMTGEERAITLLRQSWGNRPLSREECLVLDNIKQLARGVYPTISILCKDIEISSQQLHFLYLSKANHNHTSIQSFEETAYLNHVKNNQVSTRTILTPREELRLIGIRARRPSLPSRFVPNQQFPPSPVTDRELESLQTLLAECRSKSIHQCKSKKPKLHDDSFPLPLEPSSNLEADMLKELKESWEAHVNATTRDAVSVEIDIKYLERVKEVAVSWRRQAEEFALKVLNQPPEKNRHWHCQAHEILRIAGLVPLSTPADLASIAVDSSIIADFNDMLSLESRKKLVQSITLWLRLCVYEDKLARLLASSESGATDDFVKELDIVTIWDTAKHPYWLVFEVENAITIRQEQYKVAQHLIDHPGDIIQLNMGLGKTRVILPMLVLYFSFHNQGEKVTRLHFLSALFEEAYKYLQNHLCASILGIKIYSMPFCRDFQLDGSSIATMKNAIDDCRIDGGALVVAPEHRLSLELKAKELHGNGEKEIAALIEDEITKKDQWRDILDECDELLRHRYQLIYAIGTSAALPGGPHRWRAVQALFAAIAQSDDVKAFLSSHPKACNLTAKSTAAEWPEVQFFDGDSLNTMLGDHSERRSSRLQDGLISKLADAILSNPPHELKWLLDHPMTGDIRKGIIDKDYAPVPEMLHERQLSDVLALRGFLAGGVLRHCLLKRHRVDFGVARPGKKRLAVPFRFADTPDLRSEFAHPDCAIAFTILAYYHDGLTKEEFLKALRMLMALGESAQQKFYNSWFVASSDQMAADDLKSLDCAEKIDVTNEGQIEKMWHYYHRNMYTVNFYLNTCVLPHETDQFDSRLTATSWNLAQNPSCDIVGFSGTNDNHRILPLQVKQHFASLEKKPDPILKELDGTNGKMLEMMMNHTIGVRKLESDIRCQQSMISILTDGVNGSTVHAIIDCGALLAGTDLGNISETILKILPIKEFGGVLFYDDEQSQDWVILERSGRLLPKDLSPVREKDTFAIFDEPRCRGTDLKLRSNAVALLTLAPKLCKDKLMQAAGRLRKLDRGQKLILTGGSDVFTKLNDIKGSINTSASSSWRSFFQMKSQGFDATAIDVLSWTLKNTVESTAIGIPSWANQGVFFTSTFGKDPRLSIADENLALEDMYARSFTEQSVDTTASHAYAYHMKRTGGEEALHESVKNMVRSINERVKQYGADFKFPTGGCDEELSLMSECERELEMEIEEEEEIEVELPTVEPVNEKKWDFRKALHYQCPSELPIGTKLLPAYVENSITPTSLSKIKWSKNIYCTVNFEKTIICRANSSASVLNRFLRVANFVMCFPGGNFLLLSEFEANGLLSLFWKNDATSSNYHLVHSSFLRGSMDKSIDILLQRSLLKRGGTLSNFLFGGRLQARDVIDEDSMASLQLFSGESTYATEDRKEALKSLLRVRKTKEGARFCPRTAAESLVEMRGLLKMFPYSDLEALCEKLLCEL